MDEITALQTLVTCLLGGNMLGDAPNLHVEARELPSDLPFEIPIPHNSEIIGSVSRGTPTRQAGAIPVTTILFDTVLSPLEVRDFYLAQLLPSGWDLPSGWAVAPDASGSEGAAGSGSEDAAGRPVPPERIAFCRGGSGLTLWVNAYAGYMSTCVWLEVEPQSHLSPCAPGEGNGRRHPLDRFALVPPIGTIAIQQGRRSGGGRGYQYVTETLDTDSDLSTLAGYYAALLAHGGWVQQNNGHDGALAWSTWTFSDEGDRDQHGLLYVLRQPDKPRRYRIEIHADWRED